jgi:hypothetical protein
LHGGAANSILLCRLDEGVFTQLGYGVDAQLSTEGRVDLRLEWNASQLMVYLNDSLVLATTDSTYDGPFRIIDRSFVRYPDTEKIRFLKRLGERLSRNRDFAYYGERMYLKSDALHALSYMQESFETAKAFFSFESE